MSIVTDSLTEALQADDEAIAVRVRRRAGSVLRDGSVVAANPRVGKVIQVSADALVLAAAGGAALLFSGHELREDGVAAHQALTVSGVLLGLAFLAYRKMYSARSVALRLDEWNGVSHAMALVGLCVIAIGRFADAEVSLLWLLVFLGAGFAGLLAERELTRAWFRRQRSVGLRSRPTVIIGSSDEAHELSSTLRSNPDLGYSVLGTYGVGAVGDDPAELVETILASGATTAVLSSSAVDRPSTSSLLRMLHDRGIHVELSSGLAGIAAERLTARSLGRHSVFYIEPTVTTGWRAAAKRAFDICGAFALLVATSPVLFLCAVAVKLSSPGPVLFRQVRVGKDGKPFDVLKLRTMVADAEARLIDLRDQNEADGPLFKMKDDPRITRVGAILRKLSIDELPQLMNVLRGDMSLVGPRPALPREVEQWSGEVQNRLRVKPGITGMWQVSGRSDASFDSYVRLDLYYVDNWTLVSDLLILAKTIPVVVFSRGAY